MAQRKTWIDRLKSASFNTLAFVCALSSPVIMLVTLTFTFFYILCKVGVEFITLMIKK